MGFLMRLRRLTKLLIPSSNRILFLLDVDNLSLNTKDPEDETHVMRLPEKELNIFTAKLGKIGQFMPAFAFAPTSTLSRYGEQLHKMGFISIECPVLLHDKNGEPLTGKGDTVDPTLMEFARRMMPMLKEAGLTHICLGSADADFIPVIREAINLGLEVILLAGNTNIKSELRQLISCYKVDMHILYNIA